MSIRGKRHLAWRPINWLASARHWRRSGIDAEAIAGQELLVVLLDDEKRVMPLGLQSCRYIR